MLPCRDDDGSGGAGKGDPMKSMFRLAIVGAAILAMGCGSASGTTPDVDDADEDGAEGVGDVDTDVETGADGDGETTGEGEAGADADDDAGADADDDGGDVTDVPDVPVGECTAATDCDPLYGAAPWGRGCNGGNCEVNCRLHGRGYGQPTDGRQAPAPVRTATTRTTGSARGDDLLFGATGRTAWSLPVGTLTHRRRLGAVHG